MSKYILVKFDKAESPQYYFTGGYTAEKGDIVIAESELGVESGEVILGCDDEEKMSKLQPVKPIIRTATEEDLEHIEENREKEKEAFDICKEKIADNGLSMKLICTKVIFDNKKIMFYFSAEGRVDFRNLVKDLAAVFRTRIELRQVGVRDEARLTGGIGICGRKYCCSSNLGDCDPVSIKMAKEQNLSLNPANISGACKRLMCCLEYENSVYEELRKDMPRTGTVVVNKNDGSERGSVIGIDILNQKVKVLVSDGGEDTNVKIFDLKDIIVEDGEPR